MARSESPVPAPSGDADIIRRLLMLVFAIGTAGTCLELLLLGHFEELPQLIPVVLLTGSLIVLGAWVIFGGRRQLRLFQGTMLLFTAAGLVGIWLHYHSNVEFELEMSPAISRTDLFRESMTGAIPALAPGTMIQLGLIGLLSTYRHPVFRTNAS